MGVYVNGKNVGITLPQSGSGAVKIDNSTITKNSSDQLQASAVMNARTGTDALPIWQGTEQQWSNGGEEKTWYFWGIPSYVSDYTTAGATTVSNNIATISAADGTSYGANVLYKQDNTSVSGNAAEIVIHFNFNSYTTISTDHDVGIFSALCSYWKNQSITENLLRGSSKLYLRINLNSQNEVRLRWCLVNSNAGGNTTIAATYDHVRQAVSNHNGNLYVKLTKENNLYAAYISYNGQNWEFVSSKSLFEDPFSFEQPLLYGFNNARGFTYSVCLADTYVKVDGNNVWTPLTTAYSDGVYTDTRYPLLDATIYDAPNVSSALTIDTIVDDNNITLSDNNTYTYNQADDEITYKSIGEVHPNWLCNINGVGVKVGNTLVADYTTLDNVPTQGSTNGITSGAVYTVLGDLETALHNINSGS